MRVKGMGQKYDRFYTRLNKIDYNDKEAYLKLFEEVKKTKPITAYEYKDKYSLLASISLFIAYLTNENVEKWETIHKENTKKELYIRKKYAPLDILNVRLKNKSKERRDT